MRPWRSVTYVATSSTYPCKASAIVVAERSKQVLRSLLPSITTTKSSGSCDIRAAAKYVRPLQCGRST